MKHLRTLLGLTLLITLPLTTGAQGNGDDDRRTTNQDLCRSNVNDEIQGAQIDYYDWLFGVRRPADEPIGRVIRDDDSTFWYKQADNEWITRDPTKEGESKSDAQIAELSGHTQERQGLLQTRALLSHLIPYILQGRWALECRLDTICALATESMAFDGDAPQPIDPDNNELSVPGCMDPFDLFPVIETFPGCHDASAAKADLLTYCKTAAGGVLTRQEALLAALFESDPRALLQLMGIMDHFAVQWREPLTGVLRQTANIMGQFGRIPCFIAACDASNLDAPSPTTGGSPFPLPSPGPTPVSPGRP